MAKKIQLQDASGNVLHPLTLGECVTMDNGENLDTLMSKSQMFTPTIIQDKGMFKVGTGVDVNYSANVKDGAYESLVFKGKSLVNLLTSLRPDTSSAWVRNGSSFTLNTSGVLFLNYIALLKPNTTYTVVGELDFDVDGIVIGFREDNKSWEVTRSVNSRGRFAILISTTVQSTSNALTIHRGNTSNSSRVTLSNLMVLEGDWTNIELPPYFEGLGSVKMPILRTTGKNWLYYGETLGTPSITSYSLSNNELTITNDGAKSYQQINFVYKDLLNYKGKTLTLSGYATPNKADLKPCFQVVFQDSSGKTYYYGSTNSANTTKRMNRTFTIPYDISSDYTPRIGFVVHNANESGYSGTVVFSEIMLEESPSPTTYENHKTNILRTSEEIVLREVNGVQDTYNPLTGEYVKRIGEIVFDGREGWGGSGLANQEETLIFQYNVTSNQNIPNPKPSSLPICDKLASNGRTEDDTEGILCFNGTNGHGFYVRIQKGHLSTPDFVGFKQWLTQNPITVQYELETPVTTIVKPSTMTPFAYQNGHVIIESGFEGQSLLPEIEYSVVTGRTGQVTQNTKVLRKQEQQIIGLEELLLTQVVQMEYERTLLQFDYELQTMRLG